MYNENTIRIVIDHIAHEIFFRFFSYFWMRRMCYHLKRYDLMTKYQETDRTADEYEMLFSMLCRIHFVNRYEIEPIIKSLVRHYAPKANRYWDFFDNEALGHKERFLISHGIAKYIEKEWSE